jgi:hypothetical protein
MKKAKHSNDYEKLVMKKANTRKALIKTKTSFFRENEELNNQIEMIREEESRNTSRRVQVDSSE